MPNLFGTSPATLDFLNVKSYTRKRDVGFPYALPDGMGFTRVFRLSRFIAKPPYHRDLLRSFKHHNRHQKRFQRVLSPIRPDGCPPGCSPRHPQMLPKRKGRDLQRGNLACPYGLRCYCSKAPQGREGILALPSGKILETSVGYCYHLSNSPSAILVGLAKARPNIKHMQIITSVEMYGDQRIAHHPQPDEMQLLGGFKHLSTIEVVYRYIDAGPRPGGGDQVMAEAVAVLKKSQEKGTKWARIRVIEAGSLVGGGHTMWADWVKDSEAWGD